MLNKGNCIAQWLKGKQPPGETREPESADHVLVSAREKAGSNKGISAYVQHTVNHRLNAGEIISLRSNTQRAFNVSRVPGVHSSRFQLFNTRSSVKVNR